MKYLLVVLLILVFLRNVEAQIVVLHPKEYIKVEAKIDEEIQLEKLSKPVENAVGWEKIGFSKGTVHLVDSLIIFYLTQVAIKCIFLVCKQK